MNSWTPSSSTHEGWMPTSKMATLSMDMSPCFSPRSEQKTSGLFDTEKADNVSHSMTTYNLADVDDAWKIFEGLEDDTNTLDIELSKDQISLGDLSTGWADSDFLDSFMDLSNFVTENASEEKPDEFAEIFNIAGTSENGMEFTSVIVDDPEPVFSATFTKGGKRRHSEIESVSDTVTMLDVDTFEGVSTLDHDYVSKKPKLSPLIKSTDAASHSSFTISIDEKYRERRDKNNIASKRSREIRKNKYKDMEKEAEELVIKNDYLSKKIVELEKLAKEMKATLIKKMTAQ
ncbi:hypothetical protein CHS0354_032105 [Potamilus streckersoni]|uniref:BZIP domain-containing protein n=1 Tax=Potamilus streckersoni TaxID=2493646 RepID=A0AAE0RM17_9BIVA|nr:hypothetical protein CHS0354_032105 [Potamilus streckersoni]